MPFYEFECQTCRIQFEKLVRKMSEGGTHPCPECGADAKKRVTAGSFSFAHTPTGPVPQNTGVHDLDTKADLIIGRDAANRKKVIEARQERKRQIIRETGVTGHDLARSPGGQDYHIMKPDERRAAETARGLHNEAQKLIADDISARAERKAG